MDGKKEYYMKTLGLFNAKVDVLLQSLLVQYVQRTKKFSITFSAKKGEQPVIETQLPTPQEVREFVLTFRFFIQDNEKCSLRNMRKLYKTMPISAELRAEFNKVSDDLNTFLDSKLQGLEININKESLINRKVMEVFIYGDLAHANTEKEKIFLEWKQNPIVFPLLQLQFSSILEAILRALAYVKHLNEKAIAELS